MYILNNDFPKEIDCNYNYSLNMFSILELINSLDSYKVNINFKNTLYSNNYTGEFTDLGVSFTLSEDKNQLMLEMSFSGYDAQDFVNDIQDEIGFPEYNFEVEGTQVFITKK